MIIYISSYSGSYSSNIVLYLFVKLFSYLFNSFFKSSNSFSDNNNLGICLIVARFKGFSNSFKFIDLSSFKMN